MMDRLKDRTGLRVHAHALRHTFATVATKLGWNFEHLRAAMGHADNGVLQQYVRLATERDLGSRAGVVRLDRDESGGGPRVSCCTRRG